MFEFLSERAQDILQRTFGAQVSDVQWVYADQKGFGDCSTSIALQLAKKLNRKPTEIAEKLAEKLRGSAGVERVEVAGAGYVNVWLTPAALLAELHVTEKACTPQPVRKEEGPVIIDYSQPNIAKPLGVHHILSTVIGQCLCNLHRHLGTAVVGWNYIGDWGTQFGKLATAWEKWGKGKPVEKHTLDELLELYVRFHAEAEKNPALEDEARAAFLKLEKGDRKLRSFWEGVVRATKASLGAIYERLHVHFDTDIGESFYEDKMQSILEEGKKKQVFVKGEEGALVVLFEEESKLPPFLVQKGDGATLYATRDLAQIRYRIDTFHPQAILYVVDVAQQLYFRQLFAAAKRLDWELPQLEHVVFGRMRFADEPPQGHGAQAGACARRGCDACEGGDRGAPGFDPNRRRGGACGDDGHRGARLRNSEPESQDGSGLRLEESTRSRGELCAVPAVHACAGAVRVAEGRGEG